MSLGEKLKKLRTNLGISQKDVAQMAGIHYNTYALYERNTHHPTDEMLQRLSKVLDCSPAYLLSDQSESAMEDRNNAAEKSGGIKAGKNGSSGKSQQSGTARKDESASGKNEEPGIKISHIFEIDGSQIRTGDITSRIYAEYKAEGHKVGYIRKLDVYYNFGERRAYYVINDKAENKYIEF